MELVKLEDLTSKVNEIPAFPQSINKIMVLTENPKSQVSDIEREIMKDQSLTAKVLKLANSVFYSGNRSVNTVAQATVLLGYQAIKNMVLATTVGKVMMSRLVGYGLDKEELWRQSQICAITARIVAKKTRYANPDQAYTAGLLRDIGKIILDHYVKEQYEVVIAKVAEERMTFLDAESQVLGFHHGQVGSRIAEKWNLPPELVEAIAFHHTPDLAVVNPVLTAITHIADSLVMMMGMHIGSDGLAYTLSDNAMQLLHLNDKMIEEIIAEVTDIYNAGQNFVTFD